MMIPETGRGIIGVVVLLGAAFFIFGGVIAIVAGTVILLIVVLGKLLLIILAVVAAIAILMLPVIAAMAALAGVALLVRQAWEENLGGLRDWVEGWTNRISLAWRALVALFTEGGLSGELREEFNRAENSGVREFVGQIFDFGHRVQEFFNGFVTGFRTVWKQTAPLWAEFRVALQQLFVEVGRLFGEGPGSIVTGVNNMDPNSVNGMGQSFGTQLAQGLRVAVQAMTMFVQGMSMVIGVIRFLMPLFRAIHRTNMAIVGAFRAMASAAAAVGRALVAMWQRIPAPVRTLLLARMTGGASLAVQGMGAALQPMAQRQAAERRGHAVQAEALAASARMARKREQNARTEAAGERPAAVAAQEGVDQNQRLVTLLERRESGRGSAAENRSIARMQQQLNISGEKVAEIVTAIQERQGNLEGEVSSTSGGTASPG